MKLSCFLLLLFIEIYHTKHISSTGNAISISLERKPLTWEKLASAVKETVAFHTEEMIDEWGIPLQNERGGVGYLAQVSIGTPPQEFAMDLDTGSPQLWVVSKRCNSYNCVQNTHHFYYHENSTSYKPPSKPKCWYFIRYGKGEVQGNCSIDTVSIGGVALNNTEFLEVTYISQDYPEGTNEGLLGLVYDSINQSDIISQICRVKKQDSKFSFYFNKNISDTYGGELTLCGIDESKFNGPLHYVNETQPFGQWIIPFNGISLPNGKNLLGDLNSENALIDTGTSVIGGPSKYIDAITEAANATLTRGARLVNCSTIDKLPTITITIEKREYTFKGEDYIYKLNLNDGSETKCLLTFSPIRGNKRYSWIFGDSFLRKYYSVFDLKNHRIGFAESIHSPKAN
ncbi:aspartic protease 4-like [Planococcus citri]|uniref:aspartic protease 4-like n=1 Tax=Planococcus citri TaxID=170843 RepID=UPI0031F7473F